MKSINVVALDLGAESGRAIVGKFDGKTLALTEVHRFPNISVRLPDGLHWDILYLFNEIKTGIRKAVEATNGELTSVGLDTWGVDHGLLDENGSLTFLPYHYRDNRTDNALEEAYAVVPRSEIHKHTGLQFMSFNSLYQLLALKKIKSAALSSAKTFLTVPDLLNYWLTGKKVCEFTNATTTQCFNPTTNTWAYELLEKFELPTDIFPEIIPACTVLGPMLPHVATETTADNLTVIAPACHDTGSAVLSVPALHSDVAFISSGTWSLIGMEVPEAIITPESLAMNFTNEGCVGGHYRFLKNITGLWIVQECKRYWALQGEDLSYTEITKMASEATPLQSFINTDWNDFLKPGDMPLKIQRYCKETGQSIPQTKGEIVRCALDSLALKYREEFEKMEKAKGKRIDTLHIVGGGTQNLLLNQLAANAVQRTVVTGPIEATAVGNILGQLIALGEVSSTEEAREVVRNSFDLVTYQPQDSDTWDAAYQRYLSVQ